MARERSWIGRASAVVAAPLTALACAMGAGALELDLEAVEWTPMSGTAPAAATEIDGAPGVSLPCNFAGTDFPRASWDAAVDLDLSGAKGLEIEMRAADPAPIASVTVYLQSGGGWYRATAELPGEEWITVSIPREATDIEGAPGGWSNIATVRISAWRGGEQDTRMEIRAMRAIPAAGAIGVLRPESIASGSIVTPAARICAMLDSLGLDYRFMSDVEPGGLPLDGLRALIMPYTPGLAEGAAAEIASWMEGGGRVLAFYQLPGVIAEAGGLRPGEYIQQERPGHFAAIVPTARLQGAPERAAQNSWNITTAYPASEDAEVLAAWEDEDGERLDAPAITGSPRLVYMSHIIQPDDPDAKERLLLAMLGYLDEGVWREAAEGMLARTGQISRYASLQEMRADMTRPGAAEALEKAAALLDEARSHMERGAFIEAVSVIGAARGKALEAFASAQDPEPGEWRGVWIHRADGVSGVDWDTAIRRLAENGFTAVLPNMLWGGAAYYPSDVLPRAEEVEAGRDYIAECLAACREHGVEMHVWKVNWYMGGHAPDEFVDRMRGEGRTQVLFNGGEQPQWLCPSHPDNQQLEIGAMVEVAMNYDVDGVHFDYIRYPGPDGCFCGGCRERFEARLGEAVEDWPSATRDDPEISEAWNQFRRDQITEVVAGVAEALRRDRPDTQISAAVFSNWSNSRAGIAQDTELWCERGYLDFICPMNYTPHNHEFARQTSTQIAKAYGVPVYPGIGLSTWPGMRRDAVKLIEQIRLARESGAPGFTIFEYDQPAMRDVLPLAGMGVTRPE